MQVRDAQIIRLIERIGSHYRTNISSPYIRPALLQLSALDKQTWDLIELLCEKGEMFKYQGYELDDLYREIVAVARFVSHTRRELVPNLRNRLVGGKISGQEKVLRDMAVSNFASNLQLFAEMVNELYVSLIEMDKAEAKRTRPRYLQIAELEDAGVILASAG